MILQKAKNNMTAVLCVIFFLSGASALIFELLWFQLTGLTFGNSVWAAALVISSFMGGLALGSGLAAFRGHKIKSALRFYAFLEIIIGVSGFLLVLILPNLTKMFAPVYRAMLDHVFILNSFKAVIAFLLMFIPACAMGATLPVLVKALYREKPSFGRILGILYGWNTFGAMAGVVSGELLFVKWLGLRGAGLLAAGFNFLAAGAAFALSKKHMKKTAAPVPGETGKPGARFNFSFIIGRLLFAGFFSGFTFLALEIIWFRFMLLFFSATSWNFALMLAMVLLGISLGGMAASKWFRAWSDAHSFLFPAVLFNAIFIILLYINFGTIHKLVAGYDGTVQVVFHSLFLVFPVSFVSGIIFTMLGKALYNEIGSETKATGLLTLANTAGGMAGSIISGMVFIPYLGIEKSFFLFAVCCGVVAVSVFRKEQLNRLTKKRSLRYLVPVAYLVCLLLFPFGLMEMHYLKIPVEGYLSRGEKVVAVREDVTETLQYLRRTLLDQPYYHRLVTNNYSMSATELPGKRYMKLFVYWAAAVHPGMKNALLICYGCGMTAKGLTDTRSLENIDIVDISKDIIEESRVIFPDRRENPVHDPRVKVHIEDGRFFLLTHTRKSYDLITAEPPPPKARGIVNLYSREYFQLIRDRLSDGGIVTYWLPVYQMSVTETKAILRGFCDVFPDCSLWAGAGLEWMMVGVKNPGKPVSEKIFRRQWDDPVMGREIRALGFAGPEQFGAFFIADGRRLNDWIAGTLPLTDNYPKRISSRKETHPEAVAHYIRFLDSSAARVNFLSSRGITRIWPPTLRQKTGEHFETAYLINEILIPQAMWRRYKDVTYLHRCLHDGSLTGYLPWILNSDQAALDIIGRTLKERPGKPVNVPEAYLHLASGALRARGYLQAEYYLKLTVEHLDRANRLADHTNFTYCTLRMYLLFMAGEKERAKQVESEYLDTLEKRRGKAVRDRMNIQLNAFVRWLGQEIHIEKR
ncbi:MAG: spermidine synthase [bacterium]|nr:spermidine synthase [bacterium]